MTPEASLEKQNEAPVAAAEGTQTLTPDQALKDLVTDVSDVCTFVINVSHGFQLKEIWEGIGLLIDFRNIKDQIPAIVTQYKGLDDQARAEMLGYIQKTVSFPENANVELIVEKLLEVAVALSTVFQLLVPPAPPTT